MTTFTFHFYAGFCLDSIHLKLKMMCTFYRKTFCLKVYLFSYGFLKCLYDNSSQHLLVSFSNNKWLLYRFVNVCLFPRLLFLTVRSLKQMRCHASKWRLLKSPASAWCEVIAILEHAGTYIQVSTYIYIYMCVYARVSHKIRISLSTNNSLFSNNLGYGWSISRTCAHEVFFVSIIEMKRSFFAEKHFLV